MKHLLLIFSFVSLPFISHAQSAMGSDGYYFEETFFPKYVNHNDTSSITSAPGVKMETGLGFDTRTTFGYRFGGGSYLFGLTYNFYSLSTKRPNVQGADPGLRQTTTVFQIGPVVGWFSGGFRILFAYFLDGSREVETINFDNSGDTANATITNKDAKGFQFTVGYTFPLWGIELGPSLVYTSVSYTRQSNRDKLNPANNYSNVDLYSESVANELSPMLTVLAKF